MHGRAYVNLAMQHAKLINVLGARFDDGVTGKVNSFAPAARVTGQQGRGSSILKKCQQSSPSEHMRHGRRGVELESAHD